MSLSKAAFSFEDPSGDKFRAYGESSRICVLDFQSDLTRAQQNQEFRGSFSCGNTLKARGLGTDQRTKDDAHSSRK